MEALEGAQQVLTGLGILKAFDFKGKELWTRDIQKDYGAFGLNWEYASSPLLVDHVTVRGSRGHGVVMAHAATFDPASTWLDVTGSGADGGG